MAWLALPLLAITLAQAPTLSPETTAVPQNVSLRADIDRAIRAKAWDRAEQLLADEIARTPNSPELLKTLATICLIDRKPLNAAIAIKKAEALGPLDDATRLTLATAYIAMKRGDWARPELERLTSSSPSNLTAQYWLARLDYDDGRFADAAAKLEAVVARDKTFMRAYDNLGLCYEALNQPDRAIDFYREAIRLNREAATRSPWPVLNLAILQRRRGEVAEAESLLREAIGYEPGLARPHFELGILLEQTDRRADAVTELAAAVQADPAYAAPHYALARIHRREGRPQQADEALATFKRLREPHDPPPTVASYQSLGRFYQERAAVDPLAEQKAIDTYQKLLSVSPTDPEGLYQAAFLLARAGSFAESRALIAKLPEDTRAGSQALAILAADLAGLGDASGASAAVKQLAARPELTAADVQTLAPAFARMKDGDATQQQMLEALDARQLASAETLQRLGAIYTQRERYADARRVLERAATAAGSPTAPLLVDLARAAYKMGDAKGALGYLAHARDLDPRNAAIHFFFGIACIDLNLGSEAYESLKQAVALDPENPYINYALGAVAIHRHESSESLPYFETYVRLKPDDPRGRFALGAARVYSQQLEAAREDLRVAATHPETAAGAHYFLGRIARQLNDLATARQELDQSLKTDPRSADAWAELGLVQVRAGDYAAAEQSLAKALAIDQDHYAANFNLATLYSRTNDARREAQQARLSTLQEQRAERAQEFLRIIQVSPE